MKKLIPVVALAAALSTVACQQKTETVVDETGTVSSTSTTTYPAVDTAATTDAANDAWNTTTNAAEQAGDATATAANEAARQTGTALEHAGQEIQEETTTTNP